MSQEFDYLDVVICGYDKRRRLVDVKTYTRQVKPDTWQPVYTWAMAKAQELTAASSERYYLVHKYDRSGSLDGYISSLWQHIRSTKAGRQTK